MMFLFLELKKKKKKLQDQKKKKAALVFTSVELNQFIHLHSLYFFFSGVVMVLR